MTIRKLFNLLGITTYSKKEEKGYKPTCRTVNAGKPKDINLWYQHIHNELNKHYAK